MDHTSNTDVCRAAVTELRDVAACETALTALPGLAATVEIEWERRTHTLLVSRLEGEDQWITDALFDDTVAVFCNGPGAPGDAPQTGRAPRRRRGPAQRRAQPPPPAGPLMLVETHAIMVFALAEREADIDEYGALGLKLREAFGQAACEAGNPPTTPGVDAETSAADTIANARSSMKWWRAAAERRGDVAVLHWLADEGA